jgi:hypothetical protein
MVCTKETPPHVSIQALLLSKNLPNDIIINEIYEKHLCNSYTLLNYKQKQQIIHKDYYFNKIITCPLFNIQFIHNKFVYYYSHFNKYKEAYMIRFLHTKPKNIYEFTDKIHDIWKLMNDIQKMFMYHHVFKPQ